MISCKICHKQYTGSSGEFRARFNNYREVHQNYCKNRKVKQESFHAQVKQESFHAHFADGAHSGEGDWEKTD